MPCWNINDSDQYTDVRCFKTITRRKESFPTPTRITLGMHLDNKFGSLESSDDCDDPVFNQDGHSRIGQSPAMSQKAKKT